MYVLTPVVIRSVAYVLLPGLQARLPELAHGVSVHSFERSGCATFQALHHELRHDHNYLVHSGSVRVPHAALQVCPDCASAETARRAGREAQFREVWRGRFRYYRDKAGHRSG